MSFIVNYSNQVQRISFANAKFVRRAKKKRLKKKVVALTEALKSAWQSKSSSAHTNPSVPIRGEGSSSSAARMYKRGKLESQ